MGRRAKATVHTREVGGAGHAAHTGSREKQDLPMGPCGQNMRWLRSCLGPGWAEEPGALLPAGSIWRQDGGWGHAPEDPAPCAYRKSGGAGAPADGSGSAPSPGSGLHPNRKTSKPAPGCPGAISGEATASLQVGFTPHLPLCAQNCSLMVSTCPSR